MSLDLPSRSLFAGIEALKRKVVVNTSEPTNPRFCDSFGDQLSNIGDRSRWVLVGSANVLWHEKILSLIDELLRENQAKIYKGWGVGDDATIRHCWMVGYTKECSHPTVVVCCNIKGILRKSMRVILQDGQLRREGFELMGLTTGDLRLTTMVQGHGVRLASSAELDTLGIPRTLCGAGIVVDGSNRHATIGGVIIIDGKYYALTVAHAFVEGNASSEQPDVLEADLQFLDSNWANESSSDDESGWEIDAAKVERDHDSHRSPTSTSMEESAITGDGCEGPHFHVSTISSQNPFKDAKGSVFDGFDWALIEITEDRYHGMNEVILSETSRIPLQTLFLKNFKTSAPYGKVLAITRGGVVRGVGTGSACSIKLKNSSVYRDVWSVELDRRLSLGDSGSWVIDASTGDIYGTIVARCDSLREGYVIPATEIIENICSVTQALDVRLPTIVDTLWLASRHGNESLVRRLLVSDASAKVLPAEEVDLGAGGRHGDKLLRGEAQYGHGAAQLLAEKRTEVEIESGAGKRALHIAARYGHEPVVKLLLENRADPDSRDGVFGRTPLSYSAENGHGGVVKLLLERGANPDLGDTLGRIPLSWAAEGGHEIVVKLLLDMGANPNSTDCLYPHRMPLSWAAERGYEAVAKLLLQQGAHPDSRDMDGRTPLSWAAEWGHMSLAKLLLKNGADPNSKDHFYCRQMPLSGGAKGDREAVVELLLKSGADRLFPVGTYGRAPLFYATGGRSVTVEERLHRWSRFRLSSALSPRIAAMKTAPSSGEPPFSNRIPPSPWPPRNLPAPTALKPGTTSAFKRQPPYVVDTKPEEPNASHYIILNGYPPFTGKTSSGLTTYSLSSLRVRFGNSTRTEDVDLRAGDRTDRVIRWRAKLVPGALINVMAQDVQEHLGYELEPYDGHVELFNSYLAKPLGVLRDVDWKLRGRLYTSFRTGFFVFSNERFDAMSGLLSINAHHLREQGASHVPDTRFSPPSSPYQHPAIPKSAGAAGPPPEVPPSSVRIAGWPAEPL